MEYHPRKAKTMMAVKQKMYEDMLHRCDLCPYTTKHRQSLYRHEKSHVKSKYACMVCNMPFRCQWRMQRHVDEDHGAGKKTKPHLLNCDMCSYSSEDKGAFIRHTKRHKEADAIHCKFCNYPFLSHAQRKVHVRSVHKMQFKDHRLRKNRNATPLTDKPSSNGEHTSDRTLSNIMNNDDRTNVGVPYNYSQVADEVNKSSNIEKEVRRSTEDLSSPSKLLKDLLKCVFCDHVSKSYAELKAHLDVHDAEYDTIDAGFEDGLFMGTERVQAGHVPLVENFANQEENPTENLIIIEENTTENFKTLEENPTENFDNLKENLIENFVNPEETPTKKCVNLGEPPIENFANLGGKQTDEINRNNGNCHLETTIVGNEMYIATKYSGGQEDINMTGTSKVDDSIEETMSMEGRDFKDAMDIYEQCMSKLSKNVDDEFMMRPFACAKCFYTTGNIDHLKLHVKAHLYERARAAYNITHRLSGNTRVADMSNREIEGDTAAERDDRHTN